MITTAQLAEIKEKAKKATPGPWRQCPHVLSYVDGPDGETLLDTDVNEKRPHGLDEALANAAFVGTAHPATVLALCDEVERLTKRNAWLEDKAQEGQREADRVRENERWADRVMPDFGTMEKMEADLRAARAEADALREQKEQAVCDLAIELERVSIARADLAEAVAAWREARQHMHVYGFDPNAANDSIARIDAIVAKHKEMP